MVVELEKLDSIKKHGYNKENFPSFDKMFRNVPLSVRKKLGLIPHDPDTFFDRYDEVLPAELTVDPNANIGNQRSYSNRNAEFLKPALKKQGLKELYRGGIEMFGESFSLDPVFTGRVYIHDSTKMTKPYCVGVSLLDILLDGRPYPDVVGVPPKHMDAFCGQSVEYIMNLSNDFAGATAFADLFVVLAWFAEKENIPMSSKDHSRVSIKQQWQSIVHVLHNKYRPDGDAPFTNVSLNSPAVLLKVFDNYAFPDGKGIKDILPTVMKVQKIVAEFMAKGDPDRGGAQYRWPIVTCNFKKTDVGTEWWNYIAGLNHTGVFNICVAEMFSSCCRLLSDFKKMLRYKTYSNGSGGLKIGAHRVVAINNPGLAHDVLKEDRIPDADYAWERYQPHLDYMIDMVARYLVVHKFKILLNKIDLGYGKFFSKFRKASGFLTDIGPWLHPNMLFSTIGVHGIPDTIDLLLGKKDTILEDEGLWLAEQILKHTVNKADYMSGKFSTDWRGGKVYCIFNVEQVPAESASVTMASFFGDKIYSNQFVPLDTECDVWDRVKIEGKLSSILTGGSMTFLNIDKQMTPEQSVKFHTRIMKESNYSLNQFCINYGITICDACHKKWNGDLVREGCPDCGRYDSVHFEERVVGYWVRRNEVNQPRVENEMEKRYRHVI